MPVTMPGSARGKISRKEMASFPEEIVAIRQRPLPTLPIRSRNCCEDRDTGP